MKRTQDVLRIFKNVHDVIPSKLLLVGDGPERQLLEQQCRDLNITDDVRFLGKLDPVEELLAVSDLFLLPSQTESFGLAALEAMACQVPVISSNAGGLPEIMIDGVTGFMNNVGDVNGMTEHAIQLLLDDTQLNQFKVQAAERAKSFDLQKILPLYESFYEKVIRQQLISA